MTFAVVPACGHSKRMGRAKLALPLGARTVIEHVLGALRDGGVDRILVVIGPHVPELAPLASAAGAHVLALPEPTADMRATVEHGLDWIEAHDQPDSDSIWLLCPGDHPAITGEIVARLLDSGADQSGSIILPVHGGRRGHPTLFRWRHVAAIRRLAPNEGINTLVRLHSDETRELLVASPAILADVDTPEDYRILTECPKE